MGPLVTADAALQVIKAQEKLVAGGGQCLLEAHILDQGPAFVSPGIIDVTGTEHPDAEVFGPLVKIIRVDSFEAALQEANHTAYGLSAGLVSDDPANWDRFQRRIRAGVVNFNRPTTGAAGDMPFGGLGASGNHRPSAYYAADYCAYPMASFEADAVSDITSEIKGLKP